MATSRIWFTATQKVELWERWKPANGFTPVTTWRGSSGSPIILINRKNLRSVVVGVNAAMQLSYDAPAKGAIAALRIGSAHNKMFKAIETMWRRHQAEDGTTKP